MKRAFALSMIAFFLVCAWSAGQAQEDKKVEKKPEPDKEILGKPVGEWIKILRTSEDIKLRRVALLGARASRCRSERLPCRRANARGKPDDASHAGGARTGQ